MAAANTYGSLDDREDPDDAEMTGTLGGSPTIHIVELQKGVAVYERPEIQEAVRYTYGLKGEVTLVRPDPQNPGQNIVLGSLPWKFASVSRVLANTVKNVLREYADRARASGEPFNYNFVIPNSYVGPSGIVFFDSVTIQLVLAFMRRRGGIEAVCIPKPLISENMADVTDPMDAAFANAMLEYPRCLVSMSLAANYFEIKSLYSLVCACMAKMVRGIPPAETEKMLETKLMEQITKEQWLDRLDRQHVPSIQFGNMVEVVAGFDMP